MYKNLDYYHRYLAKHIVYKIALLFFCFLLPHYYLYCQEAFTPDSLSRLSAPETAKMIAQGNEASLRKLWTYNKAVEASISAAKIAEAEKLLRKLALKTDVNAQAITRLLLYFQIAFYHEYYRRDTVYSMKLHQKVAGTVATLIKAKNFMKKGQELTAMRKQWSISIDSVKGTRGTIAELPQLLKHFRNSPDFYKNADEVHVIYNLLNSCNRLARNKEWHGAFTVESITELEKVCYIKDPANGNMLAKNTLWFFGDVLSKLDSQTKTLSHQALSRALAHFPSGSYLKVVTIKTLVTFYKGKNFEGQDIHDKNEWARTRDSILPNAFTYENGNIIFKTALSKEETDKLYASLQVVRKNFFRLLPFKTPVTEDRNAILTIMIYPDKKSYQDYQWAFYGIGTENGGIYIEKWGTIFTFDRQYPQENQYSLEELLRHEYIHYLDARYVIPGFYGQKGTIYDLVIAWYIEGLAEALVGSMKNGQVLIRRKMLAEAQRRATMKIKYIVTSDRSKGFSFYKSSALFFNFLILRKPKLLQKVFSSIRQSDLQVCKALFNDIAADEKLEEEFQTFIKKLLKHWGKKSNKFFFEDNRDTQGKVIKL